MTELEQARKYLRQMQENLHWWRITRGSWAECYWRREGMYEHDQVLAALSWVWDAQERERNIVLTKRQARLVVEILGEYVDDARDGDPDDYPYSADEVTAVRDILVRVLYG